MITPEQIAKTGSEHSHQAALFAWCALNVKQYPELKWLFAVPNGFYSSAGQKAKMKAEGLKDGVPDVWLPVPKWTITIPSEENPSGRYLPYKCGLVIEMKVGKNKTSNEQNEWLSWLIDQKFDCHVCYSWKEARDRIMEYLNGW